MFETIQNWFDREFNPIGIDFGTDCLRVAQVQIRGREARLAAAASVDVPAPMRDDPTERLCFLRDALPDLLQSERFRGRRAVLGLPAASAFIQQLMLPALADAELQEAVTAAVQGAMHVDTQDVLIRHQSVQPAAEGRREVIAIGAARSPVVQMLTAAQDAGIDVVAMNTEPGALTDFYLHVYRRYTDQQSTTGIIDIGFSGTRVSIIRDRQLVMAKTLPTGGRHLTQAIGDALRIDTQSARMLRLKHSRMYSTSIHEREQHVLYVAPHKVHEDLMEREHALLEQASRAVTDSLCRSLAEMKEQFETSENGSAIDRLLFVGGESRDRRLCENIARHCGVTSCIGDPLLRMGRSSDVCVESGIDRRQAQPAWAVAIGLSLGPVAPSEANKREEMSDPITPGRM